MALRATRTLLRAATTPTPPNYPSPMTKKIMKKSTILEVERKFRRLTVPTLTNINAKSSSKYNNIIMNPPFRSILPLPTRTIHDIYYDTPHRALTSAGAWIRRRNGAWEAKVRRAGWKGDFVNSRFEEVNGKREVGDIVRELLALESSLKATGSTTREDGLHEDEEEKFGLDKLAEFVTTREAWLVDGEFKVVRDRMVFGHEVGEVELQVEVGGGHGMGEEEKGEVMEEMDRRIEEFMKRYAWAWEEGEAVGKLTAYFELVKRRGGKM